jgi:hypothetical protein
MTERNPLIRWSDYLESAFRRAFSNDAAKIQEDSRFQNIESVQKFVGGDIPKQHADTVERWFFITERYKMVISASIQDDKKDDRVVKTFTFMDESFCRYVESLLIVIKSKNTETVIRANAYIEEFNELLNSFEEFVFKQIMEDINSTNLKRNIIKEQMTL